MPILCRNIEIIFIFFFIFCSFTKISTTTEIMQKQKTRTHSSRLTLSLMSAYAMHIFRFIVVCTWHYVHGDLFYIHFLWTVAITRLIHAIIIIMVRVQKLPMVGTSLTFSQFILHLQYCYDDIETGYPPVLRFGMDSRKRQRTKKQNRIAFVV